MEEVVCTGWLRKSPPPGKMSFRTFWKDRWCVLKKRGQQYLLEYYKNEWATKPKGKIDLSECQQVMEGLEFEHKRPLESSHIFNIVTHKRTYYLVTTSEEDMRRWVQNLCRVCGFKTEENDHSNSQVGNVVKSSDPISIPSTGLAMNSHTPTESHRSSSNEFRKRTPSKAVSPLPTPDPGESYIHLGDCITGSKSPEQCSENGANAESHYKNAPVPKPIERQVSTISTSSIPEGPPPPPPQKVTHNKLKYDHPPPPVKPEDNYDVPPVHSPMGLAPINDTIGIYQYVPPPKPKFPNEDVNVDPLSNIFERQISKVGNVTISPASDLFGSLGADESYDVPPSRPILGQGLAKIDDDETNGNAIYDVPPQHGDIGNTYNVLPSHALIREDTGNDVYDVPPSPRPHSDSDGVYDIPPNHPDLKPLNLSQLSSSTDALAREFKEISNKNQHKDSGIVDGSDKVPPPTTPRSIKPDMYDEYVYLIEDQPYDIVPKARPVVMTPKTLNAVDIATPPPRPPKPPTLNDAHSPNLPSTPPSSLIDRYPLTDSTIHKGVAEAAELTHRLDMLQTKEGISADNSAEEDTYDVPPNHSATYLDTKIPPPGMDYQNLFAKQPGYVEMRGAGSSELVEPLDTYVPMSTDLPPDIDINYTPMGGMCHPKPPSAALLQESRRSVPPPVNRNLKPRYASMVEPPKALPTGNFYATMDSFAGMPIQSPRTRSFGKKGFQLPPGDGDERDRSDTMDSSSSSSDGDLNKDAYESMHPKANLDLYMKHEPRYQIYQNSDELHPMPSPPPPPPPATRKGLGKKDPPKKAGEIQYIDLDLEVTDDAPPPPPRSANSSGIEYISLDIERTKGLEEAMRLRQEEISKKS